MCSDSKKNSDDAACISLPGEIAGWQRLDVVETYDRESIFDYINGAGEVYRAYHFSEVNVFKYARPDHPSLTVEIFDMGSSDDAYGVFSYGRETEQSGIGGGYEYRGSLLSFWQDRYYICLLADQKTEVSESALFALANKISAELPSSSQPPKLISCLPTVGLTKHSVRYLRTFAALNYFYFLAEENILNMNLGTEAALGEYMPGSVFLLLVRYNSTAHADSAQNSFTNNFLPKNSAGGISQIENGRWVAIDKHDKFIIIVFDAVSEDQALDMIESCKMKLKDNIG
jgi:hypothetical protein